MFSVDLPVQDGKSHNLGHDQRKALPNEYQVAWKVKGLQIDSPIALLGSKPSSLFCKP
jgi:hypothetical protein